MTATQTTKTSSNSRTNKRRPGRPRKKKQSLPRAILSLLAMSWIGKVFLVSLLIVLVVGLNLLVSRQQYDLFFLLVGGELIAVACIGWLRLAFRRN